MAAQFGFRSGLHGLCAVRGQISAAVLDGKIFQRFRLSRQLRPTLQRLLIGLRADPGAKLLRDFAELAKQIQNGFPADGNILPAGRSIDTYR